MSNDKNIKVRARMITKKFNLLKTKSDKIKNFLMLNKEKPKSFWALKGIDFDIFAGDCVGLIGVNGSGKSTLSNIISGIIPPSSGTLEINGETSIISIGAGLKNQLTGIENIKLKALMSGMSNSEINEKMQTIIEFADLGKFINQPVKNYSSGMKSRLGFSIAVHQNPDILIIDEALSVGDETFYQKCVDRIKDFKKQGKTIIFVSHSLGQVSKLCEKVIWMHYGDLRQYGPTEEVLKEYKRFTNWFKKLPKDEKKKYQSKMKQNQEDFRLSEYVERSLKANTTEFVSRREARKLEKLYSEASAADDKFKPSSLIVLVALFVLLLFFSTLSFKNMSFTNFITNHFLISKVERVSSSPSRESTNKKKTRNEKNKSNESGLAEKEENTSGSSSSSSSTVLGNTIKYNSHYKIRARYIVKQGDTWTGISNYFGISVSNLQTANSVSSNYGLKTGETIYIPYE